MYSNASLHPTPQQSLDSAHQTTLQSPPHSSPVHISAPQTSPSAAPPSTAFVSTAQDTSPLHFRVRYSPPLSPCHSVTVTRHIYRPWEIYRDCQNLKPLPTKPWHFFAFLDKSLKVTSQYIVRINHPNHKVAHLTFFLQGTPAAAQKTTGTRPAQRSTIDLLVQLFPELPQHRLQMIAHTYGDNKIMAIENALAIRRAQVGDAETETLP